MELDFTTDMNEVVLSQREETEMQWRILIDQIVKGNVIPVIGSSLTMCDGKCIGDILVRSISKQCNMEKPAQSFSQLIPRFKVEHKNDDIYHLVARILDNPKNTRLTTPSTDLIALLSVKYFPFVIYTSFDSTVENAMRNIYGDRLRVLSFYNNAIYNDDIPANDNLRTPTIYYIFGKANMMGRKYVLSDKDILDFSRSWLAETDSSNKAKPAHISNSLADKFLLVLGCDYSDWLFRFIWFAMKDAKIKYKQDQDKIGFLTFDGSPNEELIEFMSRSNTFTKNISANEFINQLLSRISQNEQKLSTVDERAKFNLPKENADVFISYSRADKNLAERLYKSLIEMGLDVWYDKNNLGVGAEFWKDIRRAIRTTKIFIPILTDNIKKQCREEHVYREEWDEAIAHKRRIGHITYICPLCLSTFDIDDRESDIPEILKSHNIRIFQSYEMEDELKSFAKEIYEEVIMLRGDGK